MKIKGYVIYSEQWGVYLGDFIGLGFWSILDSPGQDFAYVFESEEKAQAYLKQWDYKPPDGAKIIMIETKHPMWASIEECVAVGIPAWNPQE